MQIIYRYRIMVFIAGFLFWNSLGICQESKKEEITWDDLEGAGSRPQATAQVTAQVQVNKDQTQQVTAPAQASKKEVALVPAQEPLKTKDAALQDKAKEAAREIKNEPLQATRESPPVKKKKAETKVKAEAAKEARKPSVKEESAWSHAATVTSEDPATNRDIFITNPDRE